MGEIWDRGVCNPIVKLSSVVSFPLRGSLLIAITWDMQNVYLAIGMWKNHFTKLLLGKKKRNPLKTLKTKKKGPDTASQQAHKASISSISKPASADKRSAGVRGFRQLN